MPALGASKLQVSPRRLDVLTGNPFALLSDLPKEVVEPLQAQVETVRTAGPKQGKMLLRESAKTGRY